MWTTASTGNYSTQILWSSSRSTFSTVGDSYSSPHPSRRQEKSLSSFSFINIIPSCSVSERASFLARSRNRASGTRLCLRPLIGFRADRTQRSHPSSSSPPLSFVRCSRMSESVSSDISRKVTIVNTAGEKLAGIIDDTGSKDLVVLCHGFRSSKDSNTLSGIAASIIKSGISTFRFDFPGNGESEGQFLYGNYWREAEDLRSVILHWRAEGRQVSAILGHSKGGNVVVLYASKYGDVSTVINISGRFGLDRGMDARFGKKGMKRLEEQGFLDVKNTAGIVEYRVTLESLKDRLATNMDLAARSIPKGIRVLTIHGSVDETVPAEDAYEFAKRIPNHSLQIITGGSHNFDTAREELSSLVMEFLQVQPSKI